MKIFKRAFTATIPVLTGYIVLGIGFGIVLVTNGFGWLHALMMSVFIYAGSMQYVGIGLLGTGAPLLTVALTTLMVNGRHLFYGISMVKRYRNTGAMKPYLIFSLTDETYSLVCNDIEGLEERELHGYYFFVSLLNHIYWISGSLIGALLYRIVKFDSEGIDFALTALFITVATDQWLNNKNHVPAIIGYGASIICLVFVGADNFLLPSMAMILGLLILYGRKDIHKLGISYNDSCADETHRSTDETGEG